MSVIEPLNLPKAPLKLTRKGDEVYVRCLIRKKDLVCTPEEWVRQHVLHYLMTDKNIPRGLIASEHSLEYNGLKKRADIVVFSRESKPVLIVECKATSVPISETTLQQIAQYNFQLNVDHLFLTNGLQHVFCTIDRERNSIQFLDDLPAIDI